MAEVLGCSTSGGCRHFTTTLIWGVGMTVFAFIMDHWHDMYYLPPIVRMVVQLLSYPRDTVVALLAELNKANTREVVAKRMRARGHTHLLQSLHLVSCCDVFIAAPQSMVNQVISAFEKYRYEYGASESADVYLDRQFINTGGPNQPLLQHSIMQEGVPIAGRQPSPEEVPSTLLIKLDVTPASLEFVMRSVLCADGAISESQLTHLKHSASRSPISALLITLQAVVCLSAVAIRLARNVAISPMEAIAAYYAVHILMNHIVRYLVGLPRSSCRPLIVYLDTHLWQDTLLPALDIVGTNHAPGAAPSASSFIRKTTLIVQGALGCIMLAFSIHWFQTVGVFCAFAGIIFVLGVATTWPLLVKYKENLIPSTAFAANLLMHSALAMAVISTAKHWSHTGFHFQTLSLQDLFFGF